MVRLVWSSVVALVLWTALTAPAAAGSGPNPFEIRTTDGIDEASFLTLEGLEQWVTIRGQHRGNPLLLVVGGLGADGPGTVSSPFVGAFQPLEADFTVVQWDMPGAGKTFAHAGKKLDPSVDAASICRDALALTDLLRGRFGQRRIVLLGVGFGSTIAARLVRDHPERYSAYVAAGQEADRRLARETAAVAYVRGLAEAAHDRKALADLDLAGPHPFADTPRDPKKTEAWARGASPYHPRVPADQRRDVLTAPHWSLNDALAIRAGMDASEARFGAAWDKGFNFGGLRGLYQAPVFVIQGDNDYDAPLALTRAWLARVRAPEKSLTVIPGAGDHALQTDPQVFARVLHDKVRPWAVRGM